MTNWELRVDDVDDPVPRSGQVLARVLACGICGSDLLDKDHLLPMVGIARELSIQFVLGDTPEEFAETHRIIASGAWDLEPIITGSVGVDGIPDAFDQLGRPDRHAKILVEPR